MQPAGSIKAFKYVLQLRVFRGGVNAPEVRLGGPEGNKRRDRQVPDRID